MELNKDELSAHLKEELESMFEEEKSLSAISKRLEILQSSRFELQRKDILICKLRERLEAYESERVEISSKDLHISKLNEKIGELECCILEKENAICKLRDICRDAKVLRAEVLHLRTLNHDQYRASSATISSLEELVKKYEDERAGFGLKVEKLNETINELSKDNSNLSRKLKDYNESLEYSRTDNNSLRSDLLEERQR